MRAGDSPYTCMHSQPTDSGVDSWDRVVRVQNHIISKPPALNVDDPQRSAGIQLVYAVPSIHMYAFYTYICIEGSEYM